MKYPEASRASQKHCTYKCFKYISLVTMFKPFAWQDELLLPETITKEIIKIFQSLLYQLVKGTF